MENTTLLVIMAFTLVTYFIPSAIAVSRKHHNASAIIATNILLGWIGIGWIVAFVWALTAVRPQLAAPGTIRAVRGYDDEY